MVDVLNDFIPPAALDQVATLLSHDSLVVKIKQERKTLTKRFLNYNDFSPNKK